MIKLHCLDQAQDYESVTFFLKMVADQNRYVLQEASKVLKCIGNNDDFKHVLIQKRAKSLEKAYFFYDLAQKSAKNLE